MLLQWHRLHTKSVTFMPKDINLLQHIGRHNSHISTNCIDKTCCNNYQFVNMYMINNLYVSHWYSS